MKYTERIRNRVVRIEGTLEEVIGVMKTTGMVAETVVINVTETNESIGEELIRKLKASGVRK